MSQEEITILLLKIDEAFIKIRVSADILKIKKLYLYRLLSKNSFIEKLNNVKSGRAKNGKLAWYKAYFTNNYAKHLKEIEKIGAGKVLERIEILKNEKAKKHKNLNDILRLVANKLHSEFLSTSAREKDTAERDYIQLVDGLYDESLVKKGDRIDNISMLDV